MSWRPVLVGIFLLILRMPSTVIDSILFVNKPDHHKSWLGAVILIAVSTIVITNYRILVLGYVTIATKTLVAMATIFLPQYWLTLIKL